MASNSKPKNLARGAYLLSKKVQALQDTLPDFLEDFFMYLAGTVSLSSQIVYLQEIRKFFMYLQEKKNIKNLTRKDICEVKVKDVNYYLVNFCMGYEKNGVFYTNSKITIARKKSIISSFFKFLYRQEIMEDDVSSKLNPIKTPKKQPDSIKRLELDEVESLLKLVEEGKGLSKKEHDYWERTKLRDRAILYFMITYGLRVSEVEQLNISSFHFNRLQFTIFRKREKESVMPLNNTAISVLKDYLEVRHKLRPKDDDALFLSLQGKRLSTRALCNLVKKYTAHVLGVSKSKGYSPHKLRATTASSLIELGFSIYDVQNLLDHENVTTTQIYAAHKKNAKRDIIANNELLEKYSDLNKNSKNKRGKDEL